MERSLKKIALIVSLGTLLSKAGGLIRQLVLAGTFGIGAAYNAYNYAYVIPGFLLVLLGGINGPFHNSMVSVLSKESKKDRAYILSSLNTIVSVFLLIITILIIIFADSIINILGPGLNHELHEIAVIQLKLMGPIGLLAGLIGLGFGSLNASNEFLIPSIAPIISSISLILGVGGFWIYLGPKASSPEFAFVGGIILAIATLSGAIGQWLIQLPALFRIGFERLKFIWDLKHPGVRKVLGIMGPAALSTGMLQINVFTDLFFASAIFGAAAAFGYSNLLIQTPLGLISNALIVPLLPTFAKLTQPQDITRLKARIRQGLILSTASMVPLGILFMVLRKPLVSMVYERGAFDSQAAALVSGLLLIYGLGMPFYLGRDLLVRVFYALGNGSTPFKFSAAGIILNIFFDWLLVEKYQAQGLLFATVLINLITCIGLLLKLNHDLNGLPLREWGFDGIKILFSGGCCGSLAWLLERSINWPDNFLGLFAELSISSTTAICFYLFLNQLLGVKEVQEISNSLLKTLFKRKDTPTAPH